MILSLESCRMQRTASTTKHVPFGTSSYRVSTLIHLQQLGGDQRGRCNEKIKLGWTADLDQWAMLEIIDISKNAYVTSFPDDLNRTGSIRIVCFLFQNACFHVTDEMVSEKCCFDGETKKGVPPTLLRDRSVSQIVFHPLMPVGISRLEMKRKRAEGTVRIVWVRIYLYLLMYGMS